MYESKPQPKIPPVLAGPILRRTSPKELCIQLLTSEPLKYELEIFQEARSLFIFNEESIQRERYQLGGRCWFEILIIDIPVPLSENSYFHYDLKLVRGEEAISIADWAPELIYQHDPLPGFAISDRLSRLAHGSCRKPHHPGGDGLARLDKQCSLDRARRPDLLIMSGDQLYADDVAGPMLSACHQLANLLELPDEQLTGAQVSSASELEKDPRCFYQRSELLPDSDTSEDLKRRFFDSKRKPIFTSASARNHLITLREVIAAYALLWSPKCWGMIDLDDQPQLKPEFELIYQEERKSIEEFAASMPAVARVLANTPTYMIFDDHDVTDDWNLTAAWEIAAYGHPFSARIIGNALIGYLLFQGLGNEPQRLRQTFAAVLEAFCANRSADNHQQLLEKIQQFPYWGYEIPTEPGIVVLDTRTQRWRSERDPNRPSGLMDWEQLVDLQHTLMDRKQVILVSAAPIFGVKLIEAIQSIFTRLGKPLLVDAENWMAHPGSANVILNIFRHSKTPEQFVVLSGDVHYSFSYDVTLRFRNRSPRIYQITSSGLRNTFPERLLMVLDRLNRWLYASWSPLNWFTKRRLMRIRPRVPTDYPSGRRLVANPGIGWVEFDDNGVPQVIAQLGADGEDHRFIASKEDEHWS